MISMVIGLFILAGVLYVFQGSRQTYRYNEELSRIQENGRIAVEVLTRDVRMAGFIGCGKQGVVTLSGAGVGGLPDLSPTTALVGNPGGVVLAGAVAGSDVLRVRRMADSASQLDPASPMASRTGAFTLLGDAGFTAGATGIISDCEEADIFTAAGVAGGVQVTPASALVRTYSRGVAGLYEENTYFVQNTGRVNRAGNAINALSVRRADGTVDEMVEGVDQMVLTYGFDSDANGDIDTYRAAAAVTDWSEVRSVRADLLISSVEDNAVVEQQGFSFLGGPAFADRKLRTAVGVTIAIRNRLN
jgi:type IV pilus assembly protein PilW